MPHPVVDRDLDTVPLAIGRQTDQPTVRHGLQGVQEEVRERLPELRRVSRDRRHGRGLNVHVIGEPGRLGFVLPAGSRQLIHVPQEFDHVHRDVRTGGGGPGELLNPPDRPRPIQGRPLDDPKLLREGRRESTLAQEELGSAEDGGQQIVEVMGHAARKLSERAKPFRLDEVGLGGLERLEQVPKEAQAPGADDLDPSRLGAQEVIKHVWTPGDFQNQVHGSGEDLHVVGGGGDPETLGSAESRGAGPARGSDIVHPFVKYLESQGCVHRRCDSLGDACAPVPPPLWRCEWRRCRAPQDRSAMGHTVPPVWPRGGHTR